jgi:UDP-N-acetylglucosamine acyltransferase
MATEIHSSAIVDKEALLDEDVIIGPNCIIEKGVKIGKATRLFSNVVVYGTTEIGENCQIYPFATIGFPPQDLKYKGEDTRVNIGSNNIIREYVSIHRASVGGDGSTDIGDNNFLMAYVHVAHDCKLGSNIVMANGTGLSGHVVVEDHALLGGMVGIHQHVRFGAYSMAGGLTRITQDIPPFVIVAGADKAKLYGINVVGLKRNGISDETINELKNAYKILFRQKISLKEAIKQVQTELPYTDEIKHLIEFIKANKRGICRSSTS